MQEIILYAVLALIIGAMLYSVLGKNVGQDPDTAPALKLANTDSGGDKPIQDNEPLFEGPGSEGLTAIHAADQNFTTAGFLDGAKAAYGMILEAYADGDKESLEGLLSSDVKTAYYDAIDDRAAKELTQTTDLARLVSAEIVDASRSGKTGVIKVSYLAELATALVDKAGEVVSGDLDVLSRVREIWSYERTLNSKNPNWILASVETHDVLAGDEGAPDHSPDTH